MCVVKSLYMYRNFRGVFRQNANLTYLLRLHFPCSFLPPLWPLTLFGSIFLSRNLLFLPWRPESWTTDFWVEIPSRRPLRHWDAMGEPLQRPRVILPALAGPYPGWDVPRCTAGPGAAGSRVPPHGVFPTTCLESVNFTSLPAFIFLILSKLPRKVFLPAPGSIARER